MIPEGAVEAEIANIRAKAPHLVLVGAGADALRPPGPVPPPKKTRSSPSTDTRSPHRSTTKLLTLGRTSSVDSTSSAETLRPAGNQPSGH